MDTDAPDPNRCKINPTATDAAPLKVEIGVDGEEDDEESNSLLSPRTGGLLSKRMKKNPSRRKVQWNDRNGNKLVEVLEFQPSDTSDSEDDEDSDSCLCTIM
ncbi:uncharacterized protein LOC131245797 [Magnolia sinica]|uniref:uncharacterized protein LOC131245797 n=1 Tax=Magnolia sinica TaxID=86752 RepID=UPI0026598869|nr:uncharacterized protein LOC131245797 [Magnolia sinica]